MASNDLTRLQGLSEGTVSIIIGMGLDRFYQAIVRARELQGILPWWMGSNPHRSCDLLQVLKMTCESRIILKHKIIENLSFTFYRIKK